MVIPLVIGKLFDVIGPIGFLAISCILCFVAVGIYVAVIITGRGLSRKQIQLGMRYLINGIDSKRHKFLAPGFWLYFDKNKTRDSFI